MKKIFATVVNNEKILGAFRRPPARHLSGSWLIRLQCREIAEVAKPGQFVMLSCGSDALLRRPFSIHQVNGDSFFIFYAVLVNGKGTNWLSQRQPGDSLDVLLPRGNGFIIQGNTRHLLLVAGGLGIAPLRFLADEASKKGGQVTLLYGTANDRRYPAERLPQDVKLVNVTEDGSVGIKGMTTELLPDYIGSADQIFACGPMAMYRAMAQMPELQNRSVQVSLEMRMACGFGVCYGCTVRTKHGLRQVCKDGPVFNLDDIVWDELMRL